MSSLRNDVAAACAHALLEMVCGALMECEHRDFEEEAFEIVMAALESYDQQRHEAAWPGKPSRN